MKNLGKILITRIKLVSFSILFCLNIFRLQIVVAAITDHKINSFADRPVAYQFMQQMQAKHNFEVTELQKLFQHYNTIPEVLTKISSPAEKLVWGKYQQLLVSPERVAKGKKFLIQYQQILLQAEQMYGVPKELIAAIIGVESFYGERTGNIPVVGALATLAFDYPPRSKFFQQELEQLLLLLREENLDPTKIMGSYAGAVSPAQFIPSSYRNYAVDFTNSGSRNLMKMENAIGSVGNYLHQHGWQPNQKVATRVVLSHNNNNYTQYIEQNLAAPKPKHLVAKLRSAGIIVTKPTPPTAALIELLLHPEQPKEYWLGFNNLYVITRYNHSTNYAMAVYQLALKLGMK